ncbi:MAG TPA: LysM peptidoglycan-binding domain-containing protein [Anaerolineaceae bacterium]|nr:LysM peptidoglycan-binding domain-containing protein [Anaerolineaceae bacterium]
MSQKNSAQNIIQSYRKRQQMGPFLIGGLAVVLVIVGILILAVWLTGNNRPGIGFLASPTPTETITNTPTSVPPTATVTLTATSTHTPTVTVTLTPAGPTQYTVKEGDTCWGIANTAKVSLEVLLAINNFPPGQCPIKVGEKIWVPTANQQLPSRTPIPTDFRGEIVYTVETGDTLQSIATEFNTTIDDIKQRNPTIKDLNKIQVGVQLKIRPNIVTATATRRATSTTAPVALGTRAPTATATK